MIIAKYIFDKSIYENFIPVFNDGYSDYTISDEINENLVTRTIESDSLPTLMRFGLLYVNGENYDTDKIPHTSLIEVLDINTSNVTNMISMFRGCENLTSINCSFNTSNVTTMSTMFAGCYKLTSLDVSNFNTSNVKNMYAIFHYCKSLTSLDVSNWNTSNVTDMDYMFRNCNQLTSLDVSNFNTSKVTDMNNMFQNCNNLTSLDVSNFDTSNVTDMSAMFAYCQSLTSLDVSNWDTSNVTDMDDVFNFCHLLKNVDVSNWDTSNVQYVNGMFGRCKQMTMIDISNFDMSAIKTSNVANYFHMFVDIPNVKTLIFGNNKFPDNINFIELFGLNEENIQLSSLEKVIALEENTVNKLTDILPDRSSKSNSGVIVTNAEISDEAISTISSKNWSIRKMVAQYRYDANTYENLIPEFNTEFSSDKYEIHDSVSEIVIDNIRWEDGFLNADGVRPQVNTIHTNYYSVLPNVKYNFSEVLNCLWYDDDKRFIEGESSAPNYLSPPNAKYVRFCKANNGKISIISAKLITRSIESVNGELPTLMRFGRAYVVSESATDNRTDSLLKVLDMNTSELIDCSSMFRYNTNLTSISCNWDTDNVTSMYGMFNYCHSLTSLDLNNFNTSNVSDMGYMFSTCNKLTSLDASNWNTSKVTTMQYMFYNCSELTSLDVSNWNTGEVASMSNMFYNCTNLTSLDVSNFNTSKVTNMQSTFQHCNNLTSLDVSNWDTSNVTNMDSMFNNCKSLTSLDVSNFNTSNVTEMQNMFYYCDKLTSLDVSNWNTGKVTNMQGLFEDCKSLTSLDVSNWDTSNVANMGATFETCASLTSLDVSNWDTSNVTNMYAMFLNCNSLTSLNVSNWNTSKVTSMSYIFHNCQSLTSLDVSNWNTSKVTDMSYIFHNCNNLTSLNVSNWNTSNVKNMGSMFYLCSNLTSLDVSKWDVSNVSNMGSMFWKCKSIKTLILNNWNISRVGYMSSMFSTNGGVIMSLETLDMTNSEINTVNKDSLFYNDDESSLSLIKNIRCNNVNTITNVLLPSLPTRSADDIGTIISDAEISEETLAALAAKNWTVVTSDSFIKVAEYVYDPDVWASLIPEFNTEFISYFIDDEEIEGEGVDGTVKTLIKRTIWSLGDLPTLMRFGYSYKAAENDVLCLKELIYLDTSKVTDMQSIFANCHNLTSLDASNWDTSNVTNMRNMFLNCESLTSLNVSNFNTSNVTDMGYMFNNCNKLTSIGDVSNWDTSNVTNMGTMFQYCYKLTSIDVSNWDTSNVTRMDYMFWDCQSLTSLDVSNWDTSNVIFMNHMFVRCKSLTSLDVSNFNTSNVINMDSMFWECKSLTSLDVSNFDTSNVIYMGSMFINCTSLTSLDVSNWDTSKVTNMSYMFWDCNNLQEVKLGENFKMSSTCNTDEFATNCPATFLYPDTKTYWLDEPLRKGDIIYSGTSVNRKMAQITFDGSEDENWETSDYYFETYLPHLTRPKQTTNATSMCDKIPYVHYSILDKHQGYGFNHSYSLRFNLKDCDITSGATLDDWKVWLQQNPITVVYELDVPVTTKLDDEKIYLDTRENCTIETDSNVPVQKITFNGFRHPIPLLKPNTTYRISFISDNEIPWNSSTESIWLGGVTNYIPTVIKKGYNTFLVETPSILTNQDFSISRQGFNISNVMITEGEEEHKEYFEGFCSSFEMERNTDENDINYGKYKVEVKTTGKNLFDGEWIIGGIEWASGKYISSLTDRIISKNFIKICPNQNIIASSNYSIFIIEYDKDKGFIKHTKADKIISTNNTAYIKIILITTDLTTNLQVEEGTVATEYEPYKGTTKTLWLDEPLYRGDMIYTTTNNDDNPKQIWLQQRMQKYVINGNETWELLRTEQGDVPSITDTTTYLECKMMLSYNQIPLGSSGLNTNDINDKGFATANSGNIERFYVDGDYAYLVIKKERLSIADPSGVKTWFKNNPMTILYTKVSDDLIKLSDETLYLDTCENCSLGVESAVRVNRITTKNFAEAGLEMLKPNTKYLVKFKSDKEGVCRTFNLGGTAIESVDIVKGWNMVEITTPNEVSDSLAIRGQGFNISEVIITEYSDLMRDCEYFEGIGSSFEMERTKNLFDFENATVRFVNHVKNSLYYDEMYVDVPPEDSYSRLLFGKLNVSEIGNKKLFFKCEGYQCACSCFNKDNELISDGGWMNENLCLTDYIVENTEYIAVYLRRIDEPEGFLNSEDANFIKKNAIYTYANSFEEIAYEPYGYKVKIKTTSIVSANDIISKLQM